MTSESTPFENTLRALLAFAAPVEGHRVAGRGTWLRRVSL